MTDLIAVNDAFALADTSFLKREALMFSRIAIPGLHRILAEPNKYDEFQTASELSWLHDKQIVFEPEFSGKSKIVNDEYLFQKDAMKRHGKDVLALMFELDWDEIEAARTDLTKRSRVRKKLDKISDLSPDDLKVIVEHKEFFDSVMLMTGSVTRMMSIELRELQHLEAFPVLSRTIRDAGNLKADKGDVVEIVLHALPTPDESTSWEEILEFRSDPESFSKFLALRHWMNNIARSGSSPNEVEDELGFLVDQYEKHFRLHRMKTRSSLLETVVVTTAGIAENLFTLNLSKVAKGMFAFRHRRIALLEQELTAPGREVAYIVSAREQFS